jgi:hypothetical protein
MGWGQPKSAGHYVDLASAILGCTLLSLGTIGSIIVRRQKIQAEACSEDKGQKPQGPAVTREAEEDWGRNRDYRRP